METSDDQTDLPILYIYDLSSDWSRYEYNRVQNKTDQLVSELREIGHPVTPLAITSQDLFSPLSKINPNDYIVFNLCEEIPGIPRSAAQVTEVLEALNFTHTGSTSQILAFSQDKQNLKRLFDKFNIPSPLWKIYTIIKPNGWKHFPAIVKPCLEHCGIGISSEAVVTGHNELHDRINYVNKIFKQPALVEDFIDGREFRVSLWGNKKVEVLPPAEMDYSQFPQMNERILSFESKTDPDSIYFQQIKPIVPANLSESELKQIQEIAISVYTLLGCRDYTALDIRQRDGKFYVLDVNPDPEINPECSLTIAASIVGYSYGKMGSHIINLAAERHPILGYNDFEN